MDADLATDDRSCPEGAAVPTRERLLDAGERLFAERGFRATSVREITLEAECNLAAVNYYFGGKANLYQEVFRRRLAAIREQRLASIRRTMSRAGEAASLELLLQAFAAVFVGSMVEGSSGRLWMQLMSRELLESHLPAEIFRAEMFRPVQEALAEAFSEVCPGLSHEAAGRSVHSLVGQLMHVVHLQRFLDACPGSAAESDEIDELIAHVIHFSAAGIRALAATPA
jgi:TetR/AcrR family transcriptional regulator, regulator of cefoperazone and chloramphenicol sensitivity